jgi:hypothetical protein
MNVLVSIMLLIAAIVGFYLLPLSNAVLWLLFLIIAYVPALAATVAGRLPARNVVELYRIGVSQVPFVGDIIKALVFPPSKNDPDPPRRGSRKPRP